MYKAFQGAETPQKSCRARRDDLAPHEWDRRTSGPVRKEALNQNTAPLGATKYHKSNDK